VWTVHVVADSLGQERIHYALTCNLYLVPTMLFLCSTRDQLLQTAKHIIHSLRIKQEINVIERSNSPFIQPTTIPPPTPIPRHPILHPLFLPSKTHRKPMRRPTLTQPPIPPPPTLLALLPLHPIPRRPTTPFPPPLLLLVKLGRRSLGSRTSIRLWQCRKTDSLRRRPPRARSAPAKNRQHVRDAEDRRGWRGARAARPFHRGVSRRGWRSCRRRMGAFGEKTRNGSSRRGSGCVCHRCRGARQERRGGWEFAQSGGLRLVVQYLSKGYDRLLRDAAV
jgi:hypothetical protein